MIRAMEVTDRPLLALAPVLAAVLAIIVVAILQGADAVAVALPSFLTILPLLRRVGRPATWRPGCSLRSEWPSTPSAVSSCCPWPPCWPGSAMCSTPRAAACAALLACLTVLAAGCGDDGAATCARHHRGGPAGAPAHALRAGAADRAGRRRGPRHGGRGAPRRRPGARMAGDVRVIVRTLDDGGVEGATDPRRCADNAGRAVADPRALAVIGTYELACSERALRVLRPAGLLLVSPLNAAGNLPGALRLAPTTADQGTAAAQLAEALGATRVAIVSQSRACHRVRDRSRLGRGGRRHRSGRRSGCLRDADPRAHGRAAGGAVEVVALAGSPGPGGHLLRAIAAVPKAQRPSVVAPQAFGTLAFLDDAGAAAEGLRVLSRFVPAEQLGGDARDFAGAYADLHGQPPPVALYAADAARAVLEAVAGTTASRAAVATALRALPPHDGLLGRWAATPPAASRRAGWRYCSWPAGRFAPNGWSRSPSRRRRPAG